jgi:hypothetical protein
MIMVMMMLMATQQLGMKKEGKMTFPFFPVDHVEK